MIDLLTYVFLTFLWAACGAFAALIFFKNDVYRLMKDHIMRSIGWLGFNNDQPRQSEEMNQRILSESKTIYNFYWYSFVILCPVMGLIGLSLPIESNFLSGLVSSGFAFLIIIVYRILLDPKVRVPEYIKKKYTPQ